MQKVPYSANSWLTPSLTDCCSQCSVVIFSHASPLLAAEQRKVDADLGSMRTGLICRAVRSAMQPGRTKLLMLESPTNPRMQVCDLKALAIIAREAGALSVVDNSILTFLYQRPLDLGADVSMTSATKFIGGHSDVMAGVLAVRDDALAKQIYFHQVCDFILQNLSSRQMAMRLWPSGSTILI